MVRLAGARGLARGESVPAKVVETEGIDLVAEPLA